MSETLIFTIVVACFCVTMACACIVIVRQYQMISFLNITLKAWIEQNQQLNTLMEGEIAKRRTSIAPE